MRTQSSADPAGLRLQVHLARSGVGSRRGCADVVRAGRVEINGELILEPGKRVGADDRVTVDGHQVQLAKTLVYVALHKPQGYVCTTSDRGGRPLAGSLIKAHRQARLFHVGRLDIASSGLIFFTNDGDFSLRVTHPRYRVEKEYLVRATQDIRPEFLEQFRKGINVEGENYRLLRYRVKGRRSASLVLLEGRNREIRKVFTAARIPLADVHRVRIGDVRLGSLPPAAFRSLTPLELAGFRAP